MQESNVFDLRAQHGPQETFLSCEADIAFYGGAAGGGKSFALLMEPLRHYNNGSFGCVIFRRNTVQVRNEGGLWHESQKMYIQLKGHPREAVLEWQFPSGMRVKFAHLEYDRTVYDWQGSQIPFIGFDELTHFTEKQFLYMLSRNRSTSGVPGYVRGTCNPDADSWVRKWIDWWIGPDGFAIPERSGVIRWYIRSDDKMIWADTKEELIRLYGSEQIPKSFTFINSSIYDNKILMEKDPGYLSNLKSQSKVERERLLNGNWNIRPSSGMYFKREYFEVLSALPHGWIGVCRYWDRASTLPNPNNQDPDWTRGLKMYKYPNGLYVVAHIASIRDTPLKVERLIKNTASQDGPEVMQVVEQEPGSSGQADADNFVRLLSGSVVEVERASRDKITRALPVSAQSEHGNIKLLAGPWNEDFFAEVENFPPELSQSIKKKTDEDIGHDDIVDVLSGAFNKLSSDITAFNAF